MFTESIADPKEVNDDVTICVPGQGCQPLSPGLVRLMAEADNILMSELSNADADEDEDNEEIPVPERRGGGSGSYLFRSRKSDILSDEQPVARRGHGYLLRTRKSVLDAAPEISRELRGGSYLFRTRKSGLSRPGYLFRTRKADPAIMERMLRSKGYLFRTRKGGSYLFRTK